MRYINHGFVSGQHGQDPEKFRAIEYPTTISNLKSAFGLFNYYCDYINNYGEVAKLLTDLAKKNIPENIPWYDVEENAFQKLQSLLCKPPILYTPRIE